MRKRATLQVAIHLATVSTTTQPMRPLPTKKFTRTCASDDEVRKEWTKIWRQDEDGHPNANLSSMFMEVEHILDASQANHLISCQCEAHHGPEPIEHREAAGHGTSEREESSGERRPEHDGCSSPPGTNDDPEKTTNPSANVSIRLANE